MPRRIFGPKREEGTRGQPFFVQSRHNSHNNSPSMGRIRIYVSVGFEVGVPKEQADFIDCSYN